MWIEIYKGPAAGLKPGYEFRWRVVAKNTKILADSGEGYQRKEKLRHTLRTLFAGRLEIVDLTRAPS